MLFKICKNISVALIFCSIGSIANAGINGTTAHSRANCVNNESITWWLGHSYNWRVVRYAFN